MQTKIILVSLVLLLPAAMARAAEGICCEAGRV